MPISITMPALSPTMEEGSLAKWHVKEGDKVEAGDVIAEIETDKATMEVEAVDEGTVAKLLVEEGSEGVAVNAVIALLAEDGEDPKSVSLDDVKSPNDADDVDADNSGADDSDDDTNRENEDDVKTSQEPSSKASNQTKSSSRQAQTSNSERIKASPLARRIAQNKGIDLSSIKGSGPYGRIVKKDVEEASSSINGDGKTASIGRIAFPTSDAQTKLWADSIGESESLNKLGYNAAHYSLKKMDGMRKTIARRMTESFRDVPHFPLSIDLEIDRLLATRKALNSEYERRGAKVKISVNDMLIRASAMALMNEPEANASYTAEGLAYHHNADIAVAVAIEGGLITPVIREAQNKDFTIISEEMKDLASRARERKLKPEEYSGGTFSISNLGMFGIKSFGSIINEPQGMILSIGAGVEQAIVKDGKIVSANIMNVTLTCDHRVVDGATGAKWLQAFRHYVETPEAMMI